MSQRQTAWKEPMQAEWTLLAAADFAEIEEEWEALADTMGTVPALDFRFWSLLLQYFGTGDELVCLCRYDGDPIAAAIVRSKGLGRWETFAPAQAPIGAWVTGQSAAGCALLGALAKALPKYVTSIGLTRLDTKLLCRPKNHGTLTTLDYISTGQITWKDTFETYWQSRSKNLRHNVNRQRNYLRRNDVQTRLHEVRCHDSIGASVDAYGILESVGWKGKSGTALHPANTQGSFYKALFERYAAIGEAIAYEYYYDSDLVAMDLCLHRDDTLIILKTTYDERQTKTSPAALMRHETVRHMFDRDGITSIEFYGKRLPWHSKWTDDFRTMYHVNFDSSRIALWLRKMRDEQIAASGVV